MINPEIRKHIIIDLTVQRLVLIPTLIALCYFAIVLCESNSERYSEFYSAAVLMTGIGWYTCYALWGISRASRAVTEEIEDNTWDQVRMSDIGAWRLVLGKLFGCTLIQWYGKILSLLLLLLGYHQNWFNITRIQFTLIVTTATILLEAIALLESLSIAEVIRNQRRPKLSFSVVGPLGLPSLYFCLASFRQRDYGHSGIHWWCITLSAPSFMFFTLLIFLCWALLGSWHLMRSELRYRSISCGGAAFSMFIVFYLYPFRSSASANEQFGEIIRVISYIIVFGGCYYSIARERKDVVRFQQLLKYITQSNLSLVATTASGWMFQLFTAVALTLALAAGDIWHWLHDSSVTILTSSTQTYVTLCLFMVRDFAIILATHIRCPGGERNDSAVVVYFSVLYILIPIVIACLTSPPAVLLVTPFGPTSSNSCILGIPGALLAVWWMIWEWRAYSKLENTTSIRPPNHPHSLISPS